MASLKQSLGFNLGTNASRSNWAVIDNKAKFPQIGYILRQLVICILLAMLLTLSLGLLQPTWSQGSVVYVNKAATGANNGNDWANAYIDLQTALSNATSGDEIWVATGIYTPGITISDTFNLVSGVGLFGGFAATETLRTQRDWIANPTILSGDIANDDITVDGVVTSTNSVLGINNYHVIFADGTGG